MRLSKIFTRRITRTFLANPTPVFKKPFQLHNDFSVKVDKNHDKSEKISAIKYKNHKQPFPYPKYTKNNRQFPWLVISGIVISGLTAYSYFAYKKLKDDERNEKFKQGFLLIINGDIERGTEMLFLAAGNDVELRKALFLLYLNKLTEGFEILDAFFNDNNLAIVPYLVFKGVLLFAGNKKNEALSSYDQALAIDSRNVKAHLNKGIVLDALGRKEEALKSYDQILMIDSRNMNAHFNRGNVLDDLGRKAEALKSYDQVLMIDSRNMNAHFNRGNVLDALGRKEEALKSYDQVLEIDSRNVNAHLNRGNVLNALGRKEEALKSYDQALAIDSRNVNAHVNKGVVLSALGWKDKALESYNQALDIDPRNVNAYVNKGNVLYALGRKEEALKSDDQILVIDPRNVNAHFNRGNVLDDLGRKDEALESYNQALAIDPRNVDAHVNRGNVLSALDRKDEALESYNQALDIDPRDVDAHLNKGVALSDLGQKDKALESYNQALAIDPQDVNVHVNKGIVLSALGRKEEALESCNQALAIDSQNVNAHAHKGNVLNDLGQKNKALESYNQALVIDPRNVNAHFNKGVVLSDLGRKDEALRSYGQALSIHPTFLKPYISYASVLIEFGRYSEAIPYFQTALTLSPNSEQASYIKLNLKLIESLLDPFNKNLSGQIEMELSTPEKKIEYQKILNKSKELMKNSKDIEKCIDEKFRGQFEDTHLHQAIINGESVDQLITPDTINSRNTSGKTPLMLAVDKNNLQLTKTLIEKKADVNAVLICVGEKSDITSLTLAQNNKNWDIYNLLLAERMAITEDAVDNAIEKCCQEMKFDFDHSENDEVFLDYIVRGFIGDAILATRYLPEVKDENGSLDLLSGIERYHTHANDFAGQVKRSANEAAVAHAEGWTAKSYLPLLARFYFSTLSEVKKYKQRHNPSLPKAFQIDDAKDVNENAVYQLMKKELKIILELGIVIKIFEKIRKDETIPNEQKIKIFEHYILGIKNNIEQLNGDDEYSILTGYTGHAIYANFKKNSEGKLKVRIDNSGSLNEHHVQDDKNQCIYPCQIEFEGKSHTYQEYLTNIFRAKFYSRNNSPKQYEGGAGWNLKKLPGKLSEDDFKKLIYPMPCQEAEQSFEPQSVGNCVVRNFQIGTAMRLRDHGLFQAVNKMEREFMLPPVKTLTLFMIPLATPPELISVPSKVKQSQSKTVDIATKRMS